MRMMGEYRNMSDLRICETREDVKSYFRFSNKVAKIAHKLYDKGGDVFL